MSNIALRFNDGKADAVPVGHALPVGEQAAVALRTAFHQVAGQRARPSKPVVVVGSPAELVHQHAQRHGRVHAAAGDHHVAAFASACAIGSYRTASMLAHRCGKAAPLNISVTPRSRSSAVRALRSSPSTTPIFRSTPSLAATWASASRVSEFHAAGIRYSRLLKSIFRKQLATKVSLRLFCIDTLFCSSSFKKCSSLISNCLRSASSLLYWSSTFFRYSSTLSSLNLNCGIVSHHLN